MGERCPGGLKWRVSVRCRWLAKVCDDGHGYGMLLVAMME